MKRSKARRLFLLTSAGLSAIVATSFEPAQAQDTPAVPNTNGAPVSDLPATTPNADDKAQAITSYNAGLDAVRKSDWETAATQFEKAVALDAKDTSSLMFLGYARLKQEKYDAALTALQTAEAMLPPGDAQGKATLYNNLGLVYWNKNRPSDAISAYLKALEFDLNATDARYNLAFAQLAQKRYADATPNLEKLVKTTTDPALLGALYDALGESYENQKNWAGALGAYTKAIDLRPKEPAYQLHKGLALINSNRKSDAAPFLQKVIELDPRSEDAQSAEAFLQLGAILIEKKNWPEAQKTLKSYTLLRPKDALGWFNLGVAYDYTGTSFNEALDAYTKAQELDPKNAAIRNNVGRIHFKRGKLDDAVVQLQEALNLDSQSFDARHNLAIVYAEQAHALDEQKKTAEAKAKYDAADKEWRTLTARVEPLYRGEADADRKAAFASLLVGARAGLAEIALVQKRYPDAIFEYEALLKVAPDNLTAKTNLGLSLYYKKDYEGAEKAYRDIIKQDKTNAAAFNNLGAVLEAQNNKAGALDAYREALRLKPGYLEAENNIKRLNQSTKIS